MILSSAPVFCLLCEKYINIKNIYDIYMIYIYIYIYIYIFHAKEVREGKRRHKLTAGQRNFILR